MTETPLDRAHAAMQAAPEDAGARLRFYDRLADAELVLLLAADSEGEVIEPDLFDVEGGRVALVFDTEARLSDFVGRAAPYAAVSGRALAGMLAGQGIGLGVNLGATPSAIVLPAEAVDWLAGMLEQRPAEIAATPEDVGRPGGVPDALLEALDQKFAATAGLAPRAYLAGVRYRGGTQGHLLAFVDARPGAEDALARAVGEALVFSGLEAGALDVAFVAASDPVAATLARHGLRIELPEPERARVLGAQAPAAPGMDPDRPPRLR